MAPSNSTNLSISIVLYETPEALLHQLLNSIDREELSPAVAVIDNSPVPTKPSCLTGRLNTLYHPTGKNLGYGKGHNLALKMLGARAGTFHLVVNPDVYWSGPALRSLTDYMNLHDEIAHAMPKVTYPDGSLQYLCKLLPTPFDLIVRRFLPDGAYSRARRERYELRSSGYDKIMNIPYLSGCFMMFRRECFESLGGFDERFFMYPEDIDITRRLHSRWKTVFFPEATIVHGHAKASYKSLRMTLIHMYNICKYFMKWGWFFDPARKSINQKVLAEISLQSEERRGKVN